jgi:predicted TIM-barrel fold metal-dependent hydrolase
VFQHQLSELAELADAFPNTTIVLNLCGLALGLGRDEQARTDVFDECRTALRAVAVRPNVLCKIGGFGLPFWAFGIDERHGAIGFEELAAAWEPFVHTAVAAFGCDR